MLDDFTGSMDMSLSKLWKIVKAGMLQSMGLQRVKHDLVTEQQDDGKRSLKISIQELVQR